MGEAEEENQEDLVCFVLMPISDPEGYETGHFRRVYEHLIVPSCEKAGFNPVRADEVKKTNHIVLDVLKKIIESEMVLCDLSSKNPNVLYELGVRQAFNLPVTIIKDESTSRVFDIQGMRDIEYDDSLRIDTTEDSIEEISSVIRNNYEEVEEDVNSLVQLLSIEPAQIPSSTELSGETSLLFESISSISERLASIEDEIGVTRGISYDVGKDSNFEDIEVGDIVDHSKFGLGVVEDVENAETEKAVAWIDFEEVGIKKLKLKYANLDAVKITDDIS